MTTTTTRAIANANTLPNENIIINGDFRVSQRGTSFPGLAAATYTLDRWSYGAAISTGIVTISQNTSTGGNVPLYHYINVDVTTVDATMDAGDVYVLTQNVEGYNVSHLNYGEPNASDVTLSFWHSHTATGTYCVALRNLSADRSYVAEYTQSVSDTWEYSTITIPGDSSGTWFRENTIGLRVAFTFGSGTNFQGTANTWNAANDLATSNQVNAMASASNNLRFGNVKLEVGSVATPFVPRSFGEELALCQRYYQQETSVVRWAYTPSTTNTAREMLFPLPVEMRANPTSTITTGSHAFTVSSVSTKQIQGFVGLGDTTTSAWAAGYTANAEL